MPDTDAAGPREPDPLILTALFDAGSFAILDGLRSRYFPAALNRVPAHATLFHHLPGADLRVLSERLNEVSAAASPPAFTMAATRSLGRGVAFEIDCPGLVALRRALAERWRSKLNAQDRQGYRPHVTIQNKVSPEEARAARLRLEAMLPIRGRIGGLALWHYRGGPWEPAGRFVFRGQ